MNQILLTNNQYKKKKNNKYNGNNSGDMKKIIIFFSIAIIIFGIAIAGIYGYKIYKNQNKEEKSIARPELSLEETENEVKIIAKAEIGIDKIIYKWNEDEPVEKEMNGRTTNEEAMEIPEGENTLTVKVIDMNGEEIESNKEFYKEGDNEAPKLEIDEDLLVREGKIKIIATDENNKIKYITYKWNDDEETTIEAEDENQTSLETTIDVKRGQNTLKITAVNGVAKEKTLERNLKGVNEPKIDVTREANKIYMRITHDMGFKKVQFTVNGKEYVYDENFLGYDSEKQEIFYQFELKEGENTVIIYAVSNENTEKEYRGKCNYTAEE